MDVDVSRAGCGQVCRLTLGVDPTAQSLGWLLRKLLFFGRSSGLTRIQNSLKEDLSIVSLHQLSIYWASTDVPHPHWFPKQWATQTEQRAWDAFREDQTLVCGVGMLTFSKAHCSCRHIGEVLFLLFRVASRSGWRRKRQPTPVLLPGESQGWGSLVGCHLWGRIESDTTEAT